MTTTIPAGDLLALAAIAAVQGDDVAAVERMLADHPELATARVEDEHAARAPCRSRCCTRRSTPPATGRRARP